MSAPTVVLLLSLLLGLQPVATDLYLPALPQITAGFGAPMTQAQLTLTAMLICFGLSQLVWGPLSDRFGRRPVLLSGMAAFVAGSAGSVFSDSMSSLITWRALQGVAMGAAVMGSRAIVRDLYAPTEGARVMSKSLTGLGVIACLTAPTGGLLTDTLGWRAALASVGVFAAVTLALVALRFEETLPDTRRQTLHPGTLVRNWVLVLRHPTFRAYSALTVFTYLGLFTFLATSSFVFIQVLGLGKTQYGLLLASMSLSYIVGTFVCRRLLLTVGVRRTVALAGWLSLAGGLLMVALAHAGAGKSWYGAWAIMGPFYLFMLGHGVHQPCGQSGAVGPFPQAAGTASAVNGFLMMIAAFFVGGWIGTHMDGTVFPLVHGVGLWGTMVALTAWTAVWRHGGSSH
jgi:DHA1 family bicyclomycin/chloramphenicol resistance-like MFS transporter